VFDINPLELVRFRNSRYFVSSCSFSCPALPFSLSFSYFKCKSRKQFRSFSTVSDRFHPYARSRPTVPALTPRIRGSPGIASFHPLNHRHVISALQHDCMYCTNMAACTAPWSTPPTPLQYARGRSTCSYAGAPGRPMTSGPQAVRPRPSPSRPAHHRSPQRACRCG
jgi:hypothetical protein